MKHNSVANPNARYSKTAQMELPTESLSGMEEVGSSMAQNVLARAADPGVGKYNSGSVTDDPAQYYEFAAEKKRKPERDEGTSVPDSVTSPVESGKGNSDGNRSNSKGKDQYTSYSGSYGSEYKKDSKQLIYGQKSEKKKAKSAYVISSVVDMFKRKSSEYLKRNYKAEFGDKKQESRSLYDILKSVASGIYDRVLKVKSYLKPKNYDGKPTEGVE